MIDEASNTVDGRTIPNVKKLRKIGLPRHPPSDAMSFFGDPLSRVPIAAVCLNDAFHMLCEARYALLEGYRRMEYYRSKVPPRPLEATYFGQFYAFDAILRLYASGEHLAGAICEMLGIENDRLKSHRDRRAGRQAAIAKLLMREMPENSLAVALSTLRDSESWKLALKYRNDWVHSQPPLVSGMGLTFKRGTRYLLEWRDGRSRGFEVTMGGGDQPEISVDDLLEVAREASCRFADAFVTGGEYYNALLEQAAATTRSRYSSTEHGFEPVATFRVVPAR